MTPRSRAALERVADFAAPVAAIAFAVVYVALTYGLTRESRIFPHTAAAIVIVFGLILIVQEIGRERPAEPVERPRSRALIVLASSVALVAMTWAIGFAAGAFIFLLALQLMLRQPLLLSLAVAAGVTGAFYTLFAVLLGVQL